MTLTHAHRVSVRTDRLGLRQRSAGGFTLIEVLVVVAIIALLVSILLPSLNRAREGTKKLICATNMRTIFQATFLYCQQNADYFPYDCTLLPNGIPVGANAWEFFYKYVQKGLPRHMTDAEVKEKFPRISASWMPPSNSNYYVQLDWYVCAKDQYYHNSNQTLDWKLPDGTSVHPVYALSYCMPDDVMWIRGASGLAIASYKSTSIKRQSDMVVAGEYVDDAQTMRGGWILTDHGNDPTMSPQDCNQIDLFEVRHLGGGNIVFLDGHMGFYRVNRSDSTQIVGGTTRPGNWGLPPYPQAFVTAYQKYKTLDEWINSDPVYHPIGHVPAPH